MSAVPSPRTDAEPMAFTGLEFARGTVSAGGLAIVITSLGWTAVYFPMMALSVFYIVPTAIMATVLASGPAWLLGRTLRRVRRLALHLVLFAALGGAVGLLTTYAFFISVSGSAPGSNVADALPYALNGVCGALAVALARHRVARRARRVDAGLPPHATCSDPDAAAEDAVVERLASEG